eukprot:Gb_16362 [translate_table: standard]
MLLEMPARRSNYALLSQSADPADNSLQEQHHVKYTAHYSLPDRLGFDPCPDNNNNNNNNKHSYGILVDRQQPYGCHDWPPMDSGLGAEQSFGRAGIWPGERSSAGNNSYGGGRGVCASNGLQRQSSGSSFADSSLSSDYPLPTLSPSVSLNASDSAFFNALYEEGWKHNEGRLNKQADGGGSYSGKNWAQQTEESYHLQLALALRLSAEATFTEDPHLLGAHCEEPRGGSGGSARKQVEAISHRFWVNGCLSYHDKVPDGFYQIWGMNPYVWTMCSDLGESGRMPSLESLKVVDASDSSLEVILIDRRGDSHLRELENKALGLAYGCASTEEVVEQLGNLVCMLMGGAASTEHGDLMMRWNGSSKMLKDCLNCIVLPIGNLSMGLCRHRALLFKVLADTIDLPCRIARGCRYCGMDNGSSCLVQCGVDREYFVDLIGRPGSLCEPDSVLNGPSSLSIASPLRLPQLKSSQFTDEFRSLAKQYVADCEPLDLKFNNIEKVQTLGSTMDSEPGTVPSAVTLDMSNPGTPTPTNSADTSTSRLPVAIRGPIERRAKTSKEVDSPNCCRISTDIEVGKNLNCLGAVGRVPGKLQAEDQSCKEIENTSSHIESVASMARTNDEAYLQQKLLQRYKQRDVQSRFNDEEYLHQRWLKPHKQKDAQFKGTDEECLQQRIMQPHKHRDAQAVLELPHQGVNKNKEERTEEAGGVLSTKANLELSLAMDGLEIPWSDLVLKERIGAGSFGTVHHADWHGSDVAVKILIEQDFHEERLKEFLREVAIMKRLRHPNVVLFMGAVTCHPNLSIVTEYLPRGSLYRLIHRAGAREVLDERRRLRMALDVAKGMNYLHRLTPPIVHRDLKSPNLLVDKTWTVKVCDFGLSRFKANTFLSSKSAAGTPEWMAPEVLRDEPSNEKSDVYSFGVILWELVTMQQPWSGLNPAQVVGAVGFQSRRLQIPKDMNPDIATIIESCWANDPWQRPSFANIMESLKPLVKPPASQPTRGGMAPIV